MSADEVEELHVQYWRLSKLDDLETLYHEAKYSLSLLLQLFKILKDKRITKGKDIYDLIKYANHDLPYLTDKIQRLTNDVVDLELKKIDLKNVLILWNAQLSDLGQSITQYQNTIEQGVTISEIG
jgi:flagellar biosynthesis chaperone FliJ